MKQTASNDRNFQTLWSKPSPLADWETRPMKAVELSLRFSVPKEYAQRSVDSFADQPRYVEFAGGSPSEWLRAEYLFAADESPIESWAESEVAMAGKLIAYQDAQKELEVTMLEWNNHGEIPIAATKLGVSRVVMYEALEILQTPDDRWLSRIYLALIRRSPASWKVTLALDSACAPGTADEMIFQNDDIRALQTFGTLEVM